MSAQVVCGFEGFLYVFEAPVALPNELSLIRITSAPPHLLRAALFNDAALWRVLTTGEAPLASRRNTLPSIDAWETVQANLEALLVRSACIPLSDVLTHVLRQRIAQ